MDSPDCCCEQYLDCISRLIPTCHAEDYCCQRDYWLLMAPCPPPNTHETLLREGLARNLSEYEKEFIWTKCVNKWPYIMTQTTVTAPANETFSTSSLSSSRVLSSTSSAIETTTVSSTSSAIETTTVNITVSTDVLIPTLEPSTTLNASTPIGIVLAIIFLVIVLLVIAKIYMDKRKKQYDEADGKGTYDNKTTSGKMEETSVDNNVADEKKLAFCNPTCRSAADTISEVVKDDNKAEQVRKPNPIPTIR